jgi:hypothetical protein
MFEIGQRVCWETPGYSTHHGEVVAILHPGEVPDKEKFPQLHRGKYGCGKGRKHTSIVVRQDDKRAGSSKEFVWPVVSRVKPA